MRSKVKYVAAWPRWVASYGVIPQTYMRYMLFLASALLVVVAVSVRTNAGRFLIVPNVGIAGVAQEFIC